MSSENSGVSIIVCCYNSASRLPETIKHLAGQQAPPDIPWEIVIVNNASNDHTTEVALSEWTKYDVRHIAFSIVDQPVPGLSYARQKGVQVCRYPYIIFCDDDNWLAENYVSNTCRLLESYANVGILGGLGAPVTEIAPPGWFEKYSGYFAIGRQENKNGIIAGPNPYVYGAGMAVKKTVLDKLNAIGFIPLASDRKGGQLSSGGDVELCYAAKLLGYDIAFDDCLKFSHLIPQSRLSDQYLLRLVYQFGYCDIIHRPYYWLFHPQLPGFKKTGLWAIIISLHIYFLSLAKLYGPAQDGEKIALKANLEHASGRLRAAFSNWFRLKRDYYVLKKTFGSKTLQKESCSVPS